MRCLWNIHKSNRCKRNAKFLLCWQHWKNVGLVSSVVSVLLVLVFISDIIQAIKTVNEQLFHPTYSYDIQSNTIHGIIIPNEKFNEDEEVFVHSGLIFRMNYKFLKQGVHVIGCKDDSLSIRLTDTLKAKKLSGSLFLKVNDENILNITVKFFDEEGHLSCWIKENNVLLNQDQQFSWKGDDHGLEIIGEDGTVNLLLDYNQKKNQLSIMGLIGCTNSNSDIIIGYSTIGMYKRNTSRWNESIKKSLIEIKPIFDHHIKSKGRRIRKVYFPENVPIITFE